MAAQDWANYIGRKQAFYAQHRALKRNDPEFPWQVTRPAGLIGLLTKIPYLQKTYRALRGKPPLTEADDDMTMLYQVRALLHDEMSRLYFDEAVIMRKVAQGRFFFPRNTFDDFATELDSKPFNQLGYPNNLLGMPLQQAKIAVAGTNFEVISTQGFAGIINDWRQYLIERDGISFIPQPGETVLDCGACIGDTAALFAALVGPTGQVYAFDPVPLHNKLSALQKQINPALAQTLIFVPSAVGDQTTKVQTGKITDCDAITPGTLRLNNFNITTLDDYAEQQNINRVDFIKMDIEGFERDALNGAQNLIRKFKPRLAISTYHRADDFWHLPLQINAMNLGYKFAFGHHSPLRWESVIYAY